MRGKIGMKYMVLLFVAVGVLFIGGDAEARAFTLPDGRSINAEIISYNERGGVVELKLESGAVKKIKPSVFVPDDQAYIKEWLAIQDFFSPSKLKVVFKRVKGDGGKRYIASTRQPKRPIHYEVQITNKGAKSFESMRLEYRVYLNKKHKKKENSELTVHRGKIDSLNFVKGRGAFETEQYSLSEYYTLSIDKGDEFEGVSTSTGKTAEDEVEGIRVRLFYTTKRGEEIMREVYFPESISDGYGWDAQSTKPRGKKK